MQTAIDVEDTEKMRIRLNELRRIIREEISNEVGLIPPDWKIIAHHVTVIFGKDAKIWRDANPQLLGGQYQISVMNLVMDDKAAAVEVDIPPDLPLDLQEYLSMKIPHITVATSPVTKPVYSNELLGSGGGTSYPLSLTLNSTLQFEGGYLGLILDDASHSALVDAVQRLSL